MDIYVSVVFVLLFQGAHSFHEIPKQPPHSPLLTYPFEGVDYGKETKEERDKNQDCFAIYIRCIRYRTDFNPVCGLYGPNGWPYDFFSPCQIDFMNCEHRILYTIGYDGNDYKDNLIYYNGEGKDCEYYLRRAKSPEDAVRMYKGIIEVDVSEEESKGLQIVDAESIA